MRDDFRIRFCSELVTFLLELFFELEIVFDDPVVHHDNLSGAIAMRMSIFFGGAAVRGPACVADAVGALDGRLGNGFFEVAELSGGAANFQFARAVHDSDACGVVAAILELAKTLDNYRNDFFRAYVSENPAHRGRHLKFVLPA